MSSCLNYIYKINTVETYVHEIYNDANRNSLSLNLFIFIWFVFRWQIFYQSMEFIRKIKNKHTIEKFFAIVSNRPSNRFSTCFPISNVDNTFLCQGKQSSVFLLFDWPFANTKEMKWMACSPQILKKSSLYNTKTH